jgi:hypothetical protein
VSFVRVGTDLVVAVTEIEELDCSRLESYRVSVTLRSGRIIELEGQQAFDLVMAVKPSAFEGKRFRFARHAWAFHNLVAHPLLQVLAWAGFARLGFRIHDATVPRPRR